MSLKVNGQTYSWGDVDVKIPGLVLVVQEISYDDEQDMEESYGKGNRPRGYGKGNYKASGKMSMLRDDYDDVLAYCKAKGVPFYGLEWPSVVVSYANEGERTRIDELKKVVPIKRSHKAAQGDKSLTVDIDLMIVGGINWGLVGLFQFDFVGWLLGGSASIWSRIVFTLVGVAAVCGIPGLFTDETGE